MAIYNVSVPVVALIEAPDGDAAIRILADRVRKAGDVYDFDLLDDGSMDAFESEPLPWGEHPHDYGDYSDVN